MRALRTCHRTALIAGDDEHGDDDGDDGDGDSDNGYDGDDGHDGAQVPLSSSSGLKGSTSKQPTSTCYTIPITPGTATKARSTS